MNQVRKIVHADYAHGQGIMGNGINIAIVDTGLSPHPDYRSRITGWYDAIHRNPFPYDDSGHGSHVAGIAAGDGGQSRGFYAGVAPEAGLVGVKVLDRQGHHRGHYAGTGLDSEEPPPVGHPHCEHLHRLRGEEKL